MSVRSAAAGSEDGGVDHRRLGGFAGRGHALGGQCGDGNDCIVAVRNHLGTDLVQGGGIVLAVEVLVLDGDALLGSLGVQFRLDGRADLVQTGVVHLLDNGDLVAVAGGGLRGGGAGGRRLRSGGGSGGGIGGGATGGQAGHHGGGGQNSNKLFHGVSPFQAIQMVFNIRPKRVAIVLSVRSFSSLHAPQMPVQKQNCPCTEGFLPCKGR